jgi:small subunit ribosomal protein S17
MTDSSPKINRKQQLTGLVVSDRMDKTVVVKVDIRKTHAKYKKGYTLSRKFKAHDEENAYHIGDRVVIESIKPKSKEKRFAVIKKA